MARPWTVGLPSVRPERVEKNFKTERGLGWALGGPGDLRSDRTLWHHGGFGTSIWIDLDRQLVVVLLTATSYLRMRFLGQTINAVVGDYDRMRASRTSGLEEQRKELK
jgi:CubicO group peptidase (beta-lactamase class C family)